MPTGRLREGTLLKEQKRYITEQTGCFCNVRRRKPHWPRCLFITGPKEFRREAFVLAMGFVVESQNEYHEESQDSSTETDDDLLQLRPQTHFALPPPQPPPQPPRVLVELYTIGLKTLKLEDMDRSDMHALLGCVNWQLWKANYDEHNMTFFVNAAKLHDPKNWLNHTHYHFKGRQKH